MSTMQNFLIKSFDLQNVNHGFSKIIDYSKRLREVFRENKKGSIENQWS